MHIGVILDGNRRYAKKNNIHAWEGHKEGAKKIDELIEWCKEIKIKELTLYAFSIENFERPEKEKAVLFNLFRAKIKKLKKDKKIEEDKIGINFIGRLDMFPKDIYEGMQELMERTKNNNNNNNKFKINFAMAYGGRQEIVDAVKKISNSVKKGELKEEEIDEKVVGENIYLSDEPDLIIRPGGERRVSNFLIWQSYYSEWYFTDKLWPEFTKEDFVDAVKDFKNRERRFGR